MPFPLSELTAAPPHALSPPSHQGIGKAYARHLANAGLNLVLVARNQDKLNDVKKEIAEEFRDIEVVLIRADFSRPDVYHVRFVSRRGRAPHRAVA